jgi:hypothetical protein
VQIRFRIQIDTRDCLPTDDQPETITSDSGCLNRATFQNRSMVDLISTNLGRNDLDADQGRLEEKGGGPGFYSGSLVRFLNCGNLPPYRSESWKSKKPCFVTAVESPPAGMRKATGSDDELQLRGAGNELPFVGALQKASNGFAALLPVVERPVVHVHAHELVRELTTHVPGVL